MKLPKNLGLPFFAYGIFKPGELGYLRIKEYVTTIKETSIEGNLRIRDGLPIADLDGDWIIKGTLLTFDKNRYEDSYTKIIEIEPKYHYRWDTVLVGDDKIESNILAGRIPKKGSEYSDYEYFDGKRDPLFVDAFELIHETIKECHGHSPKEFFKLQMSYLLLWTIIERYVTIRYYLGRGDVYKKIKNLVDDKHFCLELISNINREASIFRADKPGQKINLDPKKPKLCIDYYYQIRSNITHRGKAAHQDIEKMRESIIELLHIMESTIENAFEESESYI